VEGGGVQWFSEVIRGLHKGIDALAL